MQECDIFLAKLNEMPKEEYEKFINEINKKFNAFDLDLDQL